MFENLFQKYGFSFPVFLFFIYYLAAQRPILDHCQGSRLTNLMFIIAFIIKRLGLLIPAKYTVGFGPGIFQFSCNALTHRFSFHMIEYLVSHHFSQISNAKNSLVWETTSNIQHTIRMFCHMKWGFDLGRFRHRHINFLIAQNNGCQ